MMAQRNFLSFNFEKISAFADTHQNFAIALQYNIEFYNQAP